jgi:hypothetical protein
MLQSQQIRAGYRFSGVGADVGVGAKIDNAMQIRPDGHAPCVALFVTRVNLWQGISFPPHCIEVAAAYACLL